MKIENNKVVTLSYELYVENDTQKKNLVEVADSSNPLVFLFGSSGFPPRFEDELQGLSQGDSFEFAVERDEAYGEYEDDAVVTFPLDMFKENGVVDESVFKVGNFIPMSDEDGNTIPGRILEVSSENIEMDFNHPLAGFDLAFKGKVIDIRDATQDEIAHGHVHGEGGHHH